MVRRASASACASITDWVASRVRRFGRRSAKAPPKRDRSRIGPNWVAVSEPSASGEPVSCSTSHPWATCCIQVPVCEISSPSQYSR